MAKFNVGDRIHSKDNPYVKYKVLQVGIVDVHGELCYQVENICDDEHKGQKHYLRIEKVDRWGELTAPASKEQLVIMNYITGDVDIYNVDSEADIDEEYISNLGYRTCDCHWMFCQNGVNVNYEDKVLL